MKQFINLSFTVLAVLFTVIISPDAMNNDPNALSELVTMAMKDAYNKSTETMREKMEVLTSGLNLPGM